MTPDQWQFIIGVMALIDAAYLSGKFYRNRDRGLLAAILPRLYVAALFLYDGLVSRQTMEPIRTATFLAIVLIFLTANINHLAEWWNRK
jgi:hypothetical protein